MAISFEVCIDQTLPLPYSVFFKDYTSESRHVAQFLYEEDMWVYLRRIARSP